MSAPLSRQIGHLCDRSSFRKDLRISSLLSDVAQDPSTSSSEWHKLNLRINSLLHPNQDLARGLTLAFEMIHQIPWDTVVAYVSQWMSSALTHFSLATQEAIALLDRILGHEAMQRAEYWRKVGSLQVPKYATALLNTVEDNETLESTTLTLALQALCRQIRLHPATYRSHAAQLQKKCSELLQKRSETTQEIGALLAVLHLTGKGQAVQVQLWTTTLDLLIKDVKMAWAACCSSFAVSIQEEETKLGLMAALPLDDMEALSEAQSRLALLLGSPPKAGVVAAFLSEPTVHAVPVPLDELISLVLSILSVTPTSAARIHPPPEATLWAAQTSLLPTAHIAALTLLASLPLTVFYSKTAKIASRLLRVIEKSSPVVRCIALRVLSLLDLPLDPESQTLIHCTRTCLAQAARLIKASDTTTSSDRKTISEKGNKRRKIYESDQIHFSQKKGFVEVDEDEYQGCIAAIAYLPSLYEGLATQLSAEHHDLAHTTGLVLLGITEISLQEQDNLTATCLESLAQLVRLSRGPILALLTTRAASLASQGLLSQHYSTKMAARSLSQSLDFTFNPRLAPKISLRLHVEEDKWNAEEEEVVLGRVELEEDRGTKEVEALREVLEIQYDQVQEDELRLRSSDAVSPLIESPRRSAFAPLQHSPDPVKPIHRPNTPRIGSPSVSSNATLSAAGSNGVAPRLSSLSPERLANAHVFGGPTTVTTTITTSTAKSSEPRKVSSPLGQSHEDAMNDDQDSDDEAIPELDLRSSDEEEEDE